MMITAVIATWRTMPLICSSHATAPHRCVTIGNGAQWSPKHGCNIFPTVLKVLVCGHNVNLLLMELVLSLMEKGT